MFKLTRKPKVSVCKQAGERSTNRECVAKKNCSFFRHSQDGLAGGAYPPDYKGGKA